MVVYDPGAPPRLVLHAGIPMDEIFECRVWVTTSTDKYASKRTCDL